MTGRPAIIDSRAGSEKPSANEGIARMVARRVQLAHLLVIDPGLELDPVAPSRVSATTGRSGSSPWLPVMTRRGRSASGISASARISDAQFLCGRRLPVASTSGPVSDARDRSAPGTRRAGERDEIDPLAAGPSRYRTISPAEDSSLIVRMRAALREASLLHPLDRLGVERRGHVLGVAPVEHVVHREHRRHRSSGAGRGSRDSASGRRRAAARRDRPRTARRTPSANRFSPLMPESIVSPGNHERSRANPSRAEVADELRVGCQGTRDAGTARGRRPPCRPWCRYS